MAIHRIESQVSGTVWKVEIQTGISDGLNIEVTSGLKKGDQVVQRPPKTIS